MDSMRSKRRLILLIPIILWTFWSLIVSLSFHGGRGHPHKYDHDSTNSRGHLIALSKQEFILNKKKYRPTIQEKSIKPLPVFHATFNTTKPEQRLSTVVDASASSSSTSDSFISERLVDPALLEYFEMVVTPYDRKMSANRTASPMRLLRPSWSKIISTL